MEGFRLAISERDFCRSNTGKDETYMVYTLDRYSGLASILKMEAADSSETVTTHEITRCTAQ
jgi:hypothetical protein